MHRLRLFAFVVLVSGSIAGCDSKPKTNPFETKKDTITPPPITEPPPLLPPAIFVLSSAFFGLAIESGTSDRGDVPTQ